MITKPLIDRIAKHEGLMCKAYKDSLGFWTIGYGHLLWPQDKNWSRYSITPEKAKEWLNEDVRDAYVGATNTPEWQWLDTHDRQGVWVEMVFNLGWDKLKKFTQTREAIRDQDWDRAAEEMLDSTWAKQVKRRAIVLADIIRSGYEANLSKATVASV